VLVFGELFRAFAARSTTRPFWRVPAFTNIALLAIVGVSTFVQIGLHHVPFTQKLFNLGGISLQDCALSLTLGLIPLAGAELIKAALRSSALHARAGVGAKS
jgi:Ca2+-transporting ATPase